MSVRHRPAGSTQRAFLMPGELGMRGAQAVSADAPAQGLLTTDNEARLKRALRGMEMKKR